MELLYLPISPWSECARWALDHHRLGYTLKLHVPLIGEPLLRLRARQFGNHLSVPLLRDAGAIVIGAHDIARYADAHGSGPNLATDHADTRQAVAHADEIMRLGRVLVSHRVSLDHDAKQEALVGVVPSALRSAFTPLVDAGIAYLRHKYGYGADSLERDEAKLEGELQKARELLDGRQTFLPTFSYADIAMAAALQPVKPVDNRYIPLGKATRRCWTQPRLHKEFADLLSWRDTIYAAYR